MKKLLNKLCILIFLMVPAALTAQNIVQLSFYAPLISTFEMKYSKDHLIVSQNGLLVFDVSNPGARPKLVGQTSYLGSTAYQLAVKDNYAYLSNGNNGVFAVYNIANFNSPVLTGSVNIPSTSFYGGGDLEIHGNYVFLVGFDSMYVVDASNSNFPQLINAIPVAHTEFSGPGEMVIDGTTLFLRTFLGIAAYNIANPRQPVLIGSMTPLHTFSTGLEIDTVRHLIFSPWVSALQEFTGYDAYDVTNVRKPEFLFSDSIEQGSGEYGVTGYSYNDTLLYISQGGSINAFNVNPAAHHFVTSFSGEDVANAIVSIEVRDSIFYDAKRGGLEVLNYTNEIPFECKTPVTLKTRVNGTTAFLGWNKVQGAKGYAVRYRRANRGWTYDSSLNNTQILGNLDPDALYYWEVSAVCDKKPRLYSEFSLTERFNTGSAIFNTGISISPNPAKGLVRISITDVSVKDVKEVVITDLSGVVVARFAFTGSGQQVSLARLRSGSYLVQALNNEKGIRAKGVFLKE